MDRVARAKEIIAEIPYMTIATASKNGIPWNSPVLAAYDDKFNFYWTSWHGTQHSLNIRENPNVFIVIFDSTVSLGSGEGVYIQANAEEMTDLEEIRRASELRYARKKQPPRPIEEFLGDAPRRMYKAVPIQCWVNFDSEVKGSIVDSRKEITLI